MSLVMTGRMYADAYRERGLAPENLSRVTEDAGTVTDPLVPWGSGGAYQTATLGVATIAYFPFAFFCWISPLVTILYGYTGWTIKPLADEKPDVFRSRPVDRPAPARRTPRRARPPDVMPGATRISSRRSLNQRGPFAWAKRVDSARHRRDYSPTHRPLESPAPMNPIARHPINHRALHVGRRRRLRLTRAPSSDRPSRSCFPERPVRTGPAASVRHSEEPSPTPHPSAHRPAACRAHQAQRGRARQQLRPRWPRRHCRTDGPAEEGAA